MVKKWSKLAKLTNPTIAGLSIECEPDVSGISASSSWCFQSKARNIWRWRIGQDFRLVRSPHPNWPRPRERTDRCFCLCTPVAHRCLPGTSPFHPPSLRRRPFGQWPENEGRTTMLKLATWNFWTGAVFQQQVIKDRLIELCISPKNGAHLI